MVDFTVARGNKIAPTHGFGWSYICGLRGITLNYLLFGFCEENDDQ